MNQSSISNTNTNTNITTASNSNSNLNSNLNSNSNSTLQSLNTSYEQASRKANQIGRQIGSSMDNFKNMMSSISLVGDSKHFQDGKNKFDILRQNLDNKNEKYKLDAMKTLIAHMTLGRDVSSLFPHVVKNVIVDSMEVKKLVYMFVVHYASQNQNLALLAISSFQKDMASPNPLVRAKALQAMATMRVSAVAHLIIIHLKNAIKDSSPYVRRTSSQVLPVVLKLDSKFRPDLISMLTTLLSDDSVAVLSGAMYAFQQICPTNWDLIHPNFRKICHLLPDMDEFGQAIALDILLKYARNQFASPFPEKTQEEENEQKDKTASKKQGEKDDNDNDNDDENDDDENGIREFLASSEKNKIMEDEEEKETLKDSKELDSDHRTLISCANNLVYSMDSSVVLNVMRLLYYCAPPEDCHTAVKAIIEHLNERREITFCLLANIASMCATRADLFSSHYKEFYIRSAEPVYIKELKLDILSKIANEGNINNILKEFQAYVRDTDTKFRCATIDAMGRCASTVPEVAEQTMRSLMQMIQTNCAEVVAASVVVIRQIIQRNPKKYSDTMVSLLRLLNKTNVPEARCAIVWIVGEYRQYIANYAPDAVRILAKTFIRESDEVKMQILNLAVKVYLSNPQKVSKLFKYILDMCKYDMNYDLRDRARLVRAVFFQKKKDKDGTEKEEKEEKEKLINIQVDPNSEAALKLRTAMQEMFLSEKKIPEVISPFVDRDHFIMGTLSHMVIHNAGDNYEPLEDFPKIPPDTREKRNPHTSVFGELVSSKENRDMGSTIDDPTDLADFTESEYEESVEDDYTDSENVNQTGTSSEVDEESVEEGEEVEESSEESTETEESATDVVETKKASKNIPQSTKSSAIAKSTSKNAKPTETESKNQKNLAAVKQSSKKNKNKSLSDEEEEERNKSFKNKQTAKNESKGNLKQKEKDDKDKESGEETASSSDELNAGVLVNVNKAENKKSQKTAQKKDDEDEDEDDKEEIDEEEEEEEQPKKSKKAQTTNKKKSTQSKKNKKTSEDEEEKQKQQQKPEEKKQSKEEPPNLLDFFADISLPDTKSTANTSTTNPILNLFHNTDINEEKQTENTKTQPEANVSETNKNEKEKANEYSRKNKVDIFEDVMKETQPFHSGLQSNSTKDFLWSHTTENK